MRASWAHQRTEYGTVLFLALNQWVVGACTLRNRVSTDCQAWTLICLSRRCFTSQLTCLSPLGARQATGVRYDTRMVQIRQRNATH
ncbi:hypothetical protein V8E53_014477 [Lactarius tabidus]